MLLKVIIHPLNADVRSESLSVIPLPCYIELVEHTCYGMPGPASFAGQRDKDLQEVLQRYSALSYYLSDAACTCPASLATPF